MTNYPDWLCDLAWRVDEMVCAGAGTLFVAHVLEWNQEHHKRSYELDSFVHRRREHEEKIRKSSRLGNEKAGPPEEGWEFEYYPHFEHQEAKRKRRPKGMSKAEYEAQPESIPTVENKSVAGWTPPDLFLENLDELEAGVESPIPLPDHPLTDIERSTVLAAIHDAICKTAGRVGPWTMEDEPGWSYFVLVAKVAELKDADRSSLEAILARVRDEVQLADKATAESAGAWKPPYGYICAKAVADLEGRIISRQTVQGWIQTDKPDYVKDPKTGTGWLDPDWVKGRVAKYKRRPK